MHSKTIKNDGIMSFQKKWIIDLGYRHVINNVLLYGGVQGERWKKNVVRSNGIIFEWMAQATTKCDLFSRINQSFQWNTYPSRFNLRARSFQIFLTVRLCLNFSISSHWHDYDIFRLWVEGFNFKSPLRVPHSVSMCSKYTRVNYKRLVHTFSLQAHYKHEKFLQTHFVNCQFCEKCKNRIKCIELVVIILLIFNILNINQQNHNTRNNNEQINVNMTSNFNYKLFIQCVIFLLIKISWIVYIYVNISWPFSVQSNRVANCKCANYYILHCTSALHLHYFPPVFIKDSAAW